MFVNGKTTVRIDEVEYNINVIFQMPSQRLKIIIPVESAKSYKVADFLFAKRFNSIVIVNEMGQEFTAYDCVCIRKITQVDEIAVVGQYKTLIKGRNIPDRGVLSFHFEGLEHFLSRFSDFKGYELSQKENSWSLLNNEGIVEAAVKVNNIDCIDSLITLLVKVREYFEFMIDKEIYVDRVIYSDGLGASIEVLNDKLLMSQNDCLINEMSHEQPKTIVEGINKWLLNYEVYKEVINIWRKTIYNQHVSDEDVFIWRCQSLELLCTLYKPLLDEAKLQIKNPKQSFPNLSNFLDALNIKHKFIECDKDYFDEVKDVRNVYTHYNPNKHVSEREWRNASYIVKRALKAALGFVMQLDIKNNDFGFLIPKGTMEEIRR